MAVNVIYAFNLSLLFIISVFIFPLHINQIIIFYISLVIRK